ncbi:MAG: hypothetical protein K8T25_17030 [Planctomycetia bacterium]|nr:hypothetical protein [Planctomycetia bacterium]
MGFLKKLFRNVLREPATQAHSSFAMLTEEQMEAHLRVARYGDFLLTDAIRPAFNLEVVPRQGYRHDIYRDAETRAQVPVLMAAASTENLFELFMELLDPLGSQADVVLETSHTREGRGHTDLYREHIDLPVLKSTLYDYEDMLLNDGCTGIAVLNPRIPLEIQFDEHKLLIVYGADLKEFENILRSSGLRCDESLKFITEAEHVHSSSDEYSRQFCELKCRLGMDSGY